MDWCGSSERSARTATWTGDSDTWDDGNGHLLSRGMPLPVCDKTAGALEALGRDELVITPSTWHYQGGGCC